MIRLIAVMAALLVGLGVSLAPAQTNSSLAVSSATATGAYARLSVGNQKIARALYQAQTAPAAGASAPAPKTLDEIAAMKQGTGWGQVFRRLQDQGLIEHGNLGQVISSSNRAARSSRGTLITTATGRTYDMGNAVGYRALASVSAHP